jgi:hypothetical protein
VETNTGGFSSARIRTLPLPLLLLTEVRITLSSHYYSLLLPLKRQRR